jgi:hypothetical protein
LSGTYICSPFEPEVLAKLSSSKWEKSWRRRSAIRQQSRMFAGGPGSRSKASTVGCRDRFASASDGCSSIAASCAIQISVGRSLQTQKSMSPARSPACTVAVLTQSGRCLGQRFSKNAFSLSSTPSGKRRRVTARPERCGSIAGAMRA